MPSNDPDETPRNPARVRMEFLRCYFADQEVGEVRTLAEYQAQFPGFEEVVAAGFRTLQEPSTEVVVASVPGASRAPSDRIGPYRIVRLLGRGGQGEVYLAEDTRLERSVALKVLSGFVGTAEDASLQRFRREAEVASRLHHPGICPIFEMDVDGAVAYIAMPYLAGQTLARCITRAQAWDGGDTEALTEVEGSPAAGASPEAGNEAETPSAPWMGSDPMPSVTLIERAARALHAAHEAGVVHRDIKPGNIMILTEGRPVILDFGLARDLRGGSDLTLTTALLGTLPYMSPEQLRGQHPLDRRTDVYSLGVTLYECLTLRRPFEGPNQERLFHDILEREPVDARDHDPRISRDLAVVVATALDKDPNRRYRSALAFAEDLERVRCHEPILARPVSRWQRGRRWARRNPALATALGAIFVLLAGGLVVSQLLLARVRGEKEAKDAALAEVHRLADVRLLRLLEAEAASLWPAIPDNAPALESWVLEAEAFTDGLDLHRRTLGRLRALALPPTAATIENEREREVSLRSRLAELKRERRRLDQEGGSVADRLLPGLEDEIDRMEAWIEEREVHDFDDATRAWEHETLADVVRGMERFLRTIDAVRERLEFATEVRRRSLEEPAADWAAVVAAIADRDAHPIYRGLEIIPQLGLVPLGRDPRSGLFEFAHLQTGLPPRRDPESGRLEVTEDTGLVFVLLPGGNTTMGAQSGHPDQSHYDRDAISIEEPVHDVRLAPFFVSKYEMTQAQWVRVMDRNPSFYRVGDEVGGVAFSFLHPVESVSWIDATEVMEHLGLFLPTEAQWEYACRGGTETPWSTGETAASLADHANLADEGSVGNSGSQQPFTAGLADGHVVHAPVGSYLANAFGLHDVHGNVSEWCRDRQDGYWHPVREGDGLRLISDDIGRAPVVRGGGFHVPAEVLRSAARRSTGAEVRHRALGIRPVRRLDP